MSSFHGRKERFLCPFIDLNTSVCQNTIDSCFTLDDLLFYDFFCFIAGWAGIPWPTWPSWTSITGSGRSQTHALCTWTTGTLSILKKNRRKLWYIHFFIYNEKQISQMTSWECLCSLFLKGERGLPGDKGEKVSYFSFKCRHEWHRLLISLIKLLYFLRHLNFFILGLLHPVSNWCQRWSRPSWTTSKWQKYICVLVISGKITLKIKFNNIIYYHYYVIIETYRLV